MKKRRTNDTLENGVTEKAAFKNVLEKIKSQIKDKNSNPYVKKRAKR